MEQVLGAHPRAWHDVDHTPVVVEPFDDCRIVALQPIQRARRRATYEFMVENHGNTVASCRLHLIDSSDRVDGDFDPPAVGVAPGAASLVRLKARAHRGGLRHHSRTLDFDIEAARQVMGHIGLDPATSDLANTVINADCWVTKAENGLAMTRWMVGTIWLNPPYSSPAPWIEKLIAEST